jgi:hypothetical protein
VRAISLAILASIAAFGASQQTAKLPAATEDGLTVWVYALEGNAPAQMPTLVEGQTPNYYAIHRELNLQMELIARKAILRPTLLARRSVIL